MTARRVRATAARAAAPADARWVRVDPRLSPTVDPVTTEARETTVRVRVAPTGRVARMAPARTGARDRRVAQAHSREGLVKVDRRAATTTAAPVDPIADQRVAHDPRVVRRAASGRAQTARARVARVEVLVALRVVAGPAGLIVRRGQIGAGARDQAEAGPGLKSVAQVFRQR